MLLLISTVGNVGLGKESILRLVKHNPARIYLAARNEASSKKAIATIDAEVLGAASRVLFIRCDLASLASVQSTAHTFIELEKQRVGRDGEPRLDVLMLNAGIMATPAALTTDGYESQFGTNHMGHFLLTKLLLPTLITTAKLPGADIRVISLSSLAHTFAPGKGIFFEQLHTPMANTSSVTRYGQSKLANILFVKELQRRHETQGITAVAIHPGSVNTELYKSVISNWKVVGSLVNIAKNVFYVSVQDGAKGQLWAATAPLGDGQLQVKGGEYYEPLGLVGRGSVLSNTVDLALKLWEWSSNEVEEYK
jgi:retinol dehydrogenase-12